MAASSLLWIVALFAAICAWQMLSGWKKLRAARSSPNDPHAQMRGRIGKIQAMAGGAMLVANIVLNLPVLRALM